MTDCRILTGFGFIEFETEKVGIRSVLVVIQANNVHFICAYLGCRGGSSQLQWQKL